MGGTLLGLLFFPTETGMSVFAFSVVHNLDQGLEMGKNQNENNFQSKKIPSHQNSHREGCRRQEMMALDRMETDIVWKQGFLNS